MGIFKRKNSCSLVVGEDGNPSKTYLDLVNRYAGHREIANYLYALSKQESIEPLMAGKTRNEQGEWRASDIVEVLYSEADKVFRNRSRLDQMEINQGFKTNKGYINFTAEKALQKAQEFNDENADRRTGLVARVGFLNNGYKISIVPETESSLFTYQNILNMSRAYRGTKKVLDNLHINLDEQKYPTIFNAIEVEDNIDLWKKAAYIDNKNFMHLPTQILVTILAFSNSKALEYFQQITGYEDLYDIAHALQDFELKDPRNAEIREVLSEGQQLIDKVIMGDEEKGIKGINFYLYEDDPETGEYRIELQDEEASNIDEYIQGIHKKLKQYRLTFETIGTEITDLRSLALQTISFLKRQQDAIKKRAGRTTAESDALNAQISSLEDQILNERYYTSILSSIAYTQDLLKEDLDKLNDGLDSLNDAEGELSSAQFYDCLEKMSLIRTIIERGVSLNSLLESYITIDNYAAVGVISKHSVDQIKNLSSKLRNDLAPILQDVKNIKQNIEDKILNSVLDRQGAFEDPVIAERQRLTTEHLKNTKDITLLDRFLYAWTKSSNPMAAILGKLTRDRQDERSQLFRQAQIEIGIAHEKLLETGITDTSFVYDEYGYIESEYDWSAYYVDRREKIRELQNIQEQKRLSGLEFRNLLDEWENEHLEDLVVDDITGRTEKVPSKKYYAKELPNWTSAQREYYDTMLKIKGRLSTLAGPKYFNIFTPAYITRNMVETINESGIIAAIKNKSKKVWRYYVRGLRSEDSEERNYDTENAEGDYNSNLVREVPMYFMHKINDKSRRSLDFTKSMLAFAYSAANYATLGKMADAMELLSARAAQSVASVSTSTNEQQAQTLIYDTFNIINRLQAKESINGMGAFLNGMLDVHYYGRKNDRISKSPITTDFLKYNSIRGLSLNIRGGIANYLMGQMQNFMEAGGSEFFNLSDFTKALWRVHADPIYGVTDSTEFGNAIADFFREIKHSKVSLCRQLFDPAGDENSMSSIRAFANSWFMNAVNRDYTFALYGIGEYLIHNTTMEACLNHIKLIDPDTGKKISFWDAIEPKEGGNALQFKKNYIYEVKSVDRSVTTYNLSKDFNDPETKKFINWTRSRVRYACQSLHGALNNEDKGLIYKYFLGKAVMNFRQWMVGAFSTKFRFPYFDADIMQWREGVYYTVFRHPIKTIKTILDPFNLYMASRWDGLTPVQKANLLRAKMDFLVLCMLDFVVIPTVGEPDDDDSWWEKMIKYQIRRLSMEAHALSPIIPFSFLSNLTSIINRPIAATSAAEDVLSLINPETYTKELQRGPHKGENKAYHIFMHKLLIGPGQIRNQIKDFEQFNEAFKIFKP